MWGIRSVLGPHTPTHLPHTPHISSHSSPVLPHTPTHFPTSPPTPPISLSTAPLTSPYTPTHFLIHPMHSPHILPHSFAYVAKLPSNSKSPIKFFTATGNLKSCFGVGNVNFRCMKVWRSYHVAKLLWRSYWQPSVVSVLHSLL